MIGRDGGRKSFVEWSISEINEESSILRIRSILTYSLNGIGLLRLWCIYFT